MMRFSWIFLAVMYVQLVSQGQDAPIINDPARQTVEQLVKALSSPDPETRKSAVQSLRQLSSRITRRGALPNGPIAEHPPKVPDLAPHLMFASHDADPSVRSLALYALADSRDPAAVSRFREILQTTDPADRLTAACLLTEFDNPAGLDILKRTLINLPNERPTQRYMNADRILPALMRLTSQNFGPIPMNASLSSSRANAILLQQQYDELIQKWIKWADNPATTAPATP